MPVVRLAKTAAAEQVMTEVQWGLFLRSSSVSSRSIEAPSKSVPQTQQTSSGPLQYWQINFPGTSGINLKYTFQTIGSKPQSGWPLYIAFHGGGSTSTDENNNDWGVMASYYSGGVKNAIYVAPRGVNDQWNMHFTDQGYWLIERLIENLIIFEGVDPNRVYFLGFSAGGDAVYQYAARMSQRIAAANASAGHSNWVSLTNTMNVPLCLQCGESDAAFSRNRVTADNGIALDQLRTNYVASNAASRTLPIYTNQVFLHPTPGPPANTSVSPPSDSSQVQNWTNTMVEYCHNSWEDAQLLASPTNSNVVADYKKWRQDYNAGLYPSYTNINWGTGMTTAESITQADTNAVDFVSRFTRNPTPQTVVWDLTTVPGGSGTANLNYPHNQNYWLAIDDTTTTDYGSLISASIDKTHNLITVTSAKNYLRIFLRFNMLDLNQNVLVLMPGMQSPLSVWVDFDPHVVFETCQRMDRSLVFSADIKLRQASNGSWSVDRSGLSKL